MKRYALPLLLFFLIWSFSFSAEKGVYKVYVYFLPVGEIVFEIEGNKAVVQGETYKSLRWLYNYTFRFEASEDGYFLYEKENKKEKVYRNEEIEKKKPWLPLIVKYILEGKKPDSENDQRFPYRIEEKGDTVVIYPLKSKKVKKIIVKLSKNSRLPEEIKIEGKVNLTLKRIK
ncbi:MAG: DUF3108 domain-containing protein [Aquificae bacterium]|nr:DUF3108 domain-containing protein [Aquificota bacterium]